MKWFLSKDGDLKAMQLFKRHYSCKNQNPKISLFVGPGEKMVLVHINDNWDYDALFVWRKYKSDDKQTGINCAVFRNESNLKSSDIILQAEKFAAQRWPGERLFTFVDGAAVKSPNPGYCFLKAGWKKCGKTKINKLQILEKIVE